MEDVMQAHPLRQLESVGHRPNTLQHLKRTGESRSELALGARLQGLRQPMQQTQPHPVSHRELQFTVRGIVVLLGELLRLKEPLADFR